MLNNPTSTDARFCNTYRIDRDVFPGHYLLTFGTVIEGRVADESSFVVERGLLVNMKQSVLQYLPGLRAAYGRPVFLQPDIRRGNSYGARKVPFRFNGRNRDYRSWVVDRHFLRKQEPTQR
jgi:hypothetical protein